MKLLGMLALASLLAACEHPALSRRYPNQTGGNTRVYDAGDPACSARCTTPPGTIQIYPSDADLWAGIVGVWQICAGASSIFVDAPSDSIGVEFAPPSTELGSDPAGNLFFLTGGPTGPVRGAGFEYQQIYDISNGVLYCHGSYNSVYSVGLKYSPCPREWEMATWGVMEHAGTLVPF